MESMLVEVYTDITNMGNKGYEFHKGEKNKGVKGRNKEKKTLVDG